MPEAESPRIGSAGNAQVQTTHQNDATSVGKNRPREATNKTQKQANKERQNNNTQNARQIAEETEKGRWVGEKLRQLKCETDRQRNVPCHERQNSQ